MRRLPLDCNLVSAASLWSNQQNLFSPKWFSWEHLAPDYLASSGNDKLKDLLSCQMPNYLSYIRSFRLLNLPEWNVGIFSFLLNFFWEIQQMPFYQIPVKFFCFNMIKNCTLATVGDVGISLTAFWAVAAVSNSRQWFHQPNHWQISSFMLIGVVITVGFEALATGPLNTWKYADFMPTLPLLGTGLLPLFQWLLMPPLTIWFVKRQLY